MMKKREMCILEILSACGKAEVTSLAEQLHVSPVTVRKDLDTLEQRGLIRREHGYAIFGGNDDINNRLAFHYEEKQIIARRAAEMISAGETVMIESGSCCALLAEEIARTKPGATIVTNSAFIASYIRRIEGAQVVLLGGDFQNDAQVLVGPILNACLSQFYVDKLFIGIDGFRLKYGFTGSNHLRAQAVRDMAEHAERIIVLTESQKLLRHSVVPLHITQQVKSVVTDKNVSGEMQQELTGLGIEVCIAKA